MQAVEIIGYVAATLTTASFVPQAIRTIQTKDVTGISLVMYVLFALGVGLWLVYGVLLKSMPMIIANIVTLILALVILAMKLRYGVKQMTPTISDKEDLPAGSETVNH